jgi:plastocyanin
MPPGTPPSGVALKCDTSDEAVAGAVAAAEAMMGGGPAGEASPEAEGEAAGAAEVQIEAIDIAFNVKEIEIAANTDVTFTITNNGVAAHDFVIEGTDVDSGYLNGGQVVSVTVNLAPGEYVFFCSIPGHRAAGMVGTLIVK